MVKPSKEKYIAYKIEKGKHQFLSFYKWDEGYLNLETEFTDEEIIMSRYKSELDIWLPLWRKLIV